MLIEKMTRTIEVYLGHTVPCDFIKQDELQKLLSVHHDVLARPLEESTDWLAPGRVQRFDGQTLAFPQRSRW